MSNHRLNSVIKNNRTRLAIFSLALATFAAALSLAPTVVWEVDAQKAARRTITTPRSPKSGKTLLGTRRSRDAQVISVSQTNPDGTITPGKIITDGPLQVRTDVVMAIQKALGSTKAMRPDKVEFEGPDRRNLPDGPGAIPASQWPVPATNAPLSIAAPQTLGVQFDGATGPTETGAFPPDTEGAVGPTQFFVFLNGRLRTFNKTTGVADGVINVDSDVFFASVMTPPGAGEVTFTSDPNVRFDRLSNRWFLNIIDVTLNPTTGAITTPNRVFIAVSDAASNGIITGATVWTFYQFQGDATLFTDYPSFGIDASAMYIGGDMFTIAGSFNSTKGFVIPKAPALTGSPLTVWVFAGMVATPTGAGPFAPRGVDNYDPNNTGLTATGYFIGVDNATFSTLMLRRITNPGSLGPAPTISANISVATLTTRFPVLVPHLGNTGGNAGRLDSLDDRLYKAHLRNNRLWTAHNIGVNNTGVAGVANNRNASRWYELQDVGTTPTVRQAGTLFDNNSPNNSSQRSYWIPSIMVSGQGHAALGCSIAGEDERINAFTTGRLTADTLGTLRDGPGGAALPGYTASSTAYNPPGDPGGGNGRRWGDYSFTTLDPKDDMTLWTIQEYCNGTNTYGVRAVKLIAPPPPPTNTASPAAFQLSNPSTNVVVTGATPAGEGFYDPGPDPPAPHTTFNHISASGAGITVNSITYNSPTQVTLNVSTVGSTSGVKTITITNPDGQSTTVNVTVGPTAAPASISGSVNTSDGSPVPGVAMRLSGPVTKVTITDASGNYHFDGVETENFYTITPALVNYRFSPTQRAFSLLGNRTDAVFSAAADSIARANAIDTNEYYVRQQYLDFLGREPDQGGFEYWTAQLNECGTDNACLRARRINVSAAFFAEREFQQTGSFIYRMYKGALGRQLTFAEFSNDRVLVVEGPNLETTKVAFTNAFVARPEFVQKYQNSTTATAFVDALLQSVSSSSGTDLGSLRADLLTKYNSGGSLNESRALVVREIADNASLSTALYNNAFVLMEYFGYLRRDPDAGGYDFWLNILNNRDPGNYRGMVCAFITSAEYQQRFSPIVTRTNAECGQ